MTELWAVAAILAAFASWTGTVVWWVNRSHERRASLQEENWAMVRENLLATIKMLEKRANGFKEAAGR